MVLLTTRPLQEAVETSRVTTDRVRGRSLFDDDGPQDLNVPDTLILSGCLCSFYLSMSVSVCDCLSFSLSVCILVALTLPRSFTPQLCRSRHVLTSFLFRFTSDSVSVLCLPPCPLCPRAPWCRSPVRLLLSFSSLVPSVERRRGRG